MEGKLSKGKTWLIRLWIYPPALVFLSAMIAVIYDRVSAGLLLKDGLIIFGEIVAAVSIIKSIYRLDRAGFNKDFLTRILRSSLILLGICIIVCIPEVFHPSRSYVNWPGTVLLCFVMSFGLGPWLSISWNHLTEGKSNSKLSKFISIPQNGK